MKRWVQYLYLVYVGLLFIVFILGTFPIVLICLLLPKRWSQFILFWLLKIISNAWLIAIGMWPRVLHREKVSFHQSFLLMVNHQSFLDATLVYAAFKKPFKTLGKIELEKAPVYGILYKMVVITVDRSSVTAKAASFRRMKAELAEGTSIGIFPEGTFPDTPQPHLLPFQNGAFALALLQQVDILPVLFLDTAQRIHPSKFYRLSPGVNRAVFLPTVSVQGLNSKQTDSLRNYTQQYMQACLDFCRTNPPREVWVFATNWLKENTFAA